jgi:hypothetical protein
MSLILDGTNGLSDVNGTAAAPALRGTDANTGIYFPGADRIGFAEGGVQVGEFDASGNLLFNSGYGSAAVAYACRAWVNFDGTGTVAIRASGNVSSITDNGTGDYTVNFTTAMADANYSAVGSSGFTSSGVEAGYVGFNRVGAGGAESAPTTTAVRVNSLAQTGSVSDQKYINVAIFR